MIYLRQLDLCNSLTPKGMHRRMLRELSEFLVRQLSTIFQRCWILGKIQTPEMLISVETHVINIPRRALNNINSSYRTFFIWSSVSPLYWTRQSTELLGLKSELTLLWAEGWTQDLLSSFPTSTHQWDYDLKKCIVDSFHYFGTM